MKQTIPHPIPYQGSKRKFAALVLSYVPARVNQFIEPFAGSAAVTLAAASRHTARQYLIGDSLRPLTQLWEEIIHRPECLIEQYAEIWHAQLACPREHFLQVRSNFNETEDPALLLFLLARCVKNAVRFNSAGEFNQSADHRRTGMRPETMRQQIRGAHYVLTGRARSICADYQILLEQATSADFVFMDPPYQGVSGNNNPRYHQQLDFDRLVESLANLNARNVPYILSFDGTCGGKSYGLPMPRELNLTQIHVHTGRSSQATLSGRSDDTTESLYLSPGIAVKDLQVSLVSRPERSLELSLV